MAIKEILLLGNPLLRLVCEKVEDPTSVDTKNTAEDLADTVRDSFEMSGYGRAIAAPQIGVMKRIVYLSVPEPLVLINPEIIKKSSETMIVWDACLSFLCIFMKVRRHCQIVVRYQDLNAVQHVLHAGLENDLAELLQHEIDHLDGILAIDRAVDLQSICTRSEFERRFKQDSPYGKMNLVEGA